MIMSEILPGLQEAVGKWTCEYLGILQKFNLIPLASDFYACIITCIVVEGQL